MTQHPGRVQDDGQFLVPGASGSDPIPEDPGSESDVD